MLQEVVVCRWKEESQKREKGEVTGPLNAKRLPKWRQATKASRTLEDSWLIFYKFPACL